MVRIAGKKREGSTLLLFAMLTFALLAVAALVIDVGFVLLARRQMQTAVNTAALEGLRDFEGNGRETASQLAGAVFVDPQGEITLGAGPTVMFQNGKPMGNFYASRLITKNNLGKYLPQRANGEVGLETNTANVPQGDLVKGNHLASGDHTEDANYVRGDFEPNSSGDAFLARMRRTGEEPQDGSVTSGPPLPFLFGRGTLMLRQGNGSLGAGDNVDGAAQVERGTLVRATAIAQARPALSAGPTISPAEGINMALAGDLNSSLPGTAPLRVDVSFWQGGGTTAAWDGSTFSSAGKTVGYFIARPGDIHAGGVPVVSVGQYLTPSTVVPTLTTSDQYLPLHTTVVLGNENVDLIVGFARVSITFDGTVLTLTCDPAIASTNAVASLTQPIRKNIENAAPIANLSQDELNAVVNQLFTFNQTLRNPTNPQTIGLRVPALIRSIP